jgi:hypothetical protein
MARSASLQLSARASAETSKLGTCDLLARATPPTLRGLTAHTGFVSVRSRPWPLWVAYWGVSLAVLLLLPVVLVVGEPLRRWCFRRARRRGNHKMGTLEGAVVSNVLLIAVTAPARWLEGQVRRRLSQKP